MELQQQLFYGLYLNILEATRRAGAAVLWSSGSSGFCGVMAAAVFIWPHMACLQSGFSRAEKEV